MAEIESWTDYHLHQFRIRGRRYGISRIHGPSFRDRAQDVSLNRFQFRLRERFLYEYDFIDQWEHEIRVEESLSFDSTKTYPICTGGAKAAPPDEDCGGPGRFLALKHHYNEGYIFHRLLEMIDEGSLVTDYWNEIHEFKYWLQIDKFDRRDVNRRLQLYAVGDEEWRRP